MHTTATAMPTTVTDVMSNGKTTIANSIHRLPVTISVHHGRG
jgi:hypothetical protein